MTDRVKKILLGAGLVAIAVLLGFALWYVFFRVPPPLTKAPPVTEALPPPTGVGLPAARPGVPGVPITPTSPEGVPGVPTAIPGTPAAQEASPVARGSITAVTPLADVPAVAAARAENGRDLAFYRPDDGKFYRVTPDGSLTALSNRSFPNVETVAWAPDTSRAILEFPDGSNLLYTFAADRQVALPEHWEDFTFSRAGDEIAFKSIGLDPRDRWLVVANPDGSGAVAVEELAYNVEKIDVNWSPNQQIIATMTESRDGTRQNLFFIGRNRENFNLATLEGRQFTGTWTPTGDRMLYSVYSDRTDLKPSLWLVDAAPGSTGENREQLGLQTWADKCTFAGNETAYCAVPKFLPRGAGIVRESAANIPDNIYRIDLETGAQSLVAIPENDVVANNLVVSEDGANLFFVDGRSGQLQRLRLE